MYLPRYVGREATTYSGQQILINRNSVYTKFSECDGSTLASKKKIGLPNDKAVKIPTQQIGVKSTYAKRWETQTKT